MRGPGVAALLALVLAVVLAGCAGVHAPKSTDEPDGYNRRELPSSPGLLTGPDGSWTVYRNDAERAQQPEQQPEQAEAPAEPEPQEPPEPAGRPCEQSDPPCPAGDAPR
jgi:hypothetical protein